MTIPPDTPSALRARALEVLRANAPGAAATFIRLQRNADKIDDQASQRQLEAYLDAEIERRGPEWIEAAGRHRADHEAAVAQAGGQS